MNKKLLYVLAIVFTTMSAKAQTIFSDDFSNSSLPNWTIVNQYSNSNVIWKWSNTGQSTGDAATQFEYAGAANGHLIVDSDADGDQNGAIKEFTTVTSRAIDCSGSGTVILTFAELYARVTAVDTVVVLVSTDSINWSAVYSPAVGLGNNQSTANPKNPEIDITALAANQATVYVRFSWKSTWGYWWFVDDVRLFVPDPQNIRALSVLNTFSNGCNLSATEPVTLRFQNKGLSPITTFDASYQVNGGTIVTETVTLANALAYDSIATYTFTAPANLSAQNLYSLVAWADLAGDVQNSNDTVLGAAISVNVSNPAATAYTMGFEVPNVGSEIGGFAWTTLDANNDGFTWFLTGASANNGQVAYRYSWNTNGTTGANDWLFSPCMDLDAAKAYKVSFFSRVGQEQNGTVYDERLRVKAGTARTAAGMTDNVFDFGVINNPGYEEYKAAYKPAANGTFYFGFQCYSAEDKWWINVDDIRIEELQKPTANFTATVVGNQVNVVDASEDMITSWQWSWGDGFTSTGQTPGVHTYTTGDGSYDICLIVSNLAGSDTLCKTIVISGIDKLDVSNQVSVFPNPTNRVINVMLGEDLKLNATIEIVNTIGEVVAVRQTTGNPNEQFDMNNVAQGVYIVRITSAEMHATKRFVYSR